MNGTMRMYGNKYAAVNNYADATYVMNLTSQEKHLVVAD
jgi:hypothetical protein